jgi:glycosyltransferase involved in cell wall biosynthesis
MSTPFADSTRAEGLPCPAAGRSAVRLSVVVITRNEMANIRRCLESVHFADEVVVLDYASTDGTPDLARSLGARVEVVHDWPGFGPQKNRALALAGGAWILSLDADEWVPPDLAREILSVVNAQGKSSGAGSNAVYEMPRRSSYCGQFMSHGGWYPDYVCRLFPRGQARFSEDVVHERLLSALPCKRLQGDLMHQSIANFEVMLDKLNRYSSGRARDMHQHGRRGGLGSAIGHGLWTFFRCYFLRLGFMDGAMGFVLAVSNAQGAYYRYLKLWLLQRELGDAGR